MARDYAVVRPPSCAPNFPPDSPPSPPISPCPYLRTTPKMAPNYPQTTPKLPPNYPQTIPKVPTKYPHGTPKLALNTLFSPVLGEFGPKCSDLSET